MCSVLKPLGISAENIKLKPNDSEPMKVSFNKKLITTEKILAALKKGGHPGKVVK